MKYFGNRRYYVYGYFYPGDGDWLGRPIYIGKGCGRRWVEHLRLREKKQRKPFYRELRLLEAIGIEPEIHILQDWLTEEEAYKVEQLWIAQYGRRDIGTGYLLNQTDGGGLSIGYRHPQERRQKIREASIARWKDAEMRAKIIEAMYHADRPPQPLRHLLHVSQETREKLSKLNTKPGRGVTRDPRDGWMVYFKGRRICRHTLYCHALRNRKRVEQGLPPVKRTLLQQSLEAQWRQFSKSLDRIQHESKAAGRRYIQERKRQEAKRIRALPRVALRFDKCNVKWKLTHKQRSIGGYVLFCDAVRRKLEVEQAVRLGEPIPVRGRGKQVTRERAKVEALKKRTAKRVINRQETSRRRQLKNQSRLESIRKWHDRWCRPSRLFVEGTAPHPSRSDCCRYFKKYGWLSLTPYGPVAVQSLVDGLDLWADCVAHYHRTKMPSTHCDASASV